MKSLLFVIAFIFIIIQFQAKAFEIPYRPLYDAAHSVILEGKTQQAVIRTRSQVSEQIMGEIEQQFYYLVGQLNGRDGVVDMSQIKVQLGDTELLSEGVYQTHYSAELILAWPVELAIPASFEALLPLWADYQGKQEFFKKYGGRQAHESQCLDWGAHDVGYDMFWYYYRPENFNCELKIQTEENQNFLARFEIKLTLSDKNTSNKSPEYAKIWEDNKLEVLVMIALDKGDNPAPNDVGLGSYQHLHQELFTNLGAPVESTLGQDQRPGLQDKSLIYRWDLGEGRELIVRSFLIPGIRYYNPEFNQQYNLYTQTADLIAYNGHSGLGANIRALARLGSFLPGQYQIYFINGCDTFAYVDDALTQAHALVNPGEMGTKYLDMITNAMPAYFHDMAGSTAVLISSLKESQLTYRQILAQMPEVQRSIVSGEEDNL